MPKMIPILRIGRYKDAGGRNYDITPQVLKELVESFKSKTAPLVKGHPTNDAPAMGWVEKLKIEGDKLLASFSEITEDFKEEVAQSAFRNISASFFMPLSDSNPAKGKYCLRHVGALGASRPAIPNLGTLQEALAFSEYNDGVICFSEHEESPVKENILEKMIVGLVAKALKKQKEEMIVEVKKIIGSLNFSENNNQEENQEGEEGMLEPTKTAREIELENELSKSQDENKRLTTEKEKEERSRVIAEEVTKVATEKNLDEATTQKLTEKAEKLAEGGTSPKEAVASFAEFIADNSPKSTTHRFGDKTPDPQKGAASFAEGDTPIEETAVFADEVERLCAGGTNRQDAFRMAKNNLEKGDK